MGSPLVADRGGGTESEKLRFVWGLCRDGHFLLTASKKGDGGISQTHGPLLDYFVLGAVHGGEPAMCKATSNLKLFALLGTWFTREEFNVALEVCADTSCFVIWVWDLH